MLKYKNSDRVHYCHLLVFIVFIMAQDENTYAQNDSISVKSYYFYKGYKYGSQSEFNPMSFVLNSGFDMLQTSEYNRFVFKFPYATSTSNVFWNLGHPEKAIGEVGWWKFTRTELFPLTFKSEGAQWVPNYLLHVMGGGMSYTSISEWYRYYNVNHPKVIGFITLMAADLLNEVVEDNGYKGTNSDPIPDMYIFNLAGVALFSSEKVNGFFSKELHMADWSLQPSLTFTNKTVLNCGIYYAFKWALPFEPRLSLFSRLGLGSLSGVSWKFKNGTALSVGAGVRSGKQYLLSEKARQMGITTPFSMGIFYDKNNSLLASVQISNLSDYFINANVYPGLITLGGFSPGIWTVIDKKGHPTLGITTRYTLGLGVGYGFK